MEDDKILFKAADKNLDNKLSSEEFFTFTNPNIGMMYPVLYAALTAKDQNKDGRISGQELISNCESSKSNDWRTYERKRFNEDLEIDKNGFLTQSEILAWLMPENIHEVATEEVNYFFARADEDKNGLLFDTEISQNYKLFMDSEIINPE